MKTKATLAKNSIRRKYYLLVRKPTLKKTFQLDGCFQGRTQHSHTTNNNGKCNVYSLGLEGEDPFAWLYLSWMSFCWKSSFNMAFSTLSGIETRI